MFNNDSERELFVAFLRTKGILKIDWNCMGVITNVVREAGCALGYNDIELMQEAWMEKAKAQAVPEGYVLMPLEPTQEMLGAANLAPMPMVHIDSISGREKLRISTQYKAMVNVCKSGAEG